MNHDHSPARAASSSGVNSGSSSDLAKYFSSAARPAAAARSSATPAGPNTSNQSSPSAPNGASRPRRPPPGRVVECPRTGRCSDARSTSATAEALPIADATSRPGRGSTRRSRAGRRIPSGCGVSPRPRKVAQGVPRCSASHGARRRRTGQPRYPRPCRKRAACGRRLDSFWCEKSRLS